jgi:hypothetical protein
VEELELQHGQRLERSVVLESTGQRTASLVFLGAGALMVTAAAAAGIAALNEGAQARDLELRLEPGSGATRGLSVEESARYNRHLDRLELFRAAAGILGAGALLTGGTGFALFFFDHPVVPRARVALTTSGVAMHADF